MAIETDKISAPIASFGNVEISNGDISANSVEVYNSITAPNASFGELKAGDLYAPSASFGGIKVEGAATISDLYVTNLHYDGSVTPSPTPSTGSGFTDRIEARTIKVTEFIEAPNASFTDVKIGNGGACSIRISAGHIDLITCGSACYISPGQIEIPSASINYLKVSEIASPNGKTWYDGETANLPSASIGNLKAGDVYTPRASVGKLKADDVTTHEATITELYVGNIHYTGNVTPNPGGSGSNTPDFGDGFIDHINAGSITLTEMISAPEASFQRIDLDSSIAITPEYIELNKSNAYISAGRIIANRIDTKGLASNLDIPKASIVNLRVDDVYASGASVGELKASNATIDQATIDTLRVKNLQYDGAVTPNPDGSGSNNPDLGDVNIDHINAITITATGSIEVPRASFHQVEVQDSIKVGDDKDYDLEIYPSGIDIPYASISLNEYGIKAPTAKFNIVTIEASGPDKGYIVAPNASMNIGSIQAADIYVDDIHVKRLHYEGDTTPNQPGSDSNLGEGFIEHIDAGSIDVTGHINANSIDLKYNVQAPVASFGSIDIGHDEEVRIDRTGIALNYPQASIHAFKIEADQMGGPMASFGRVEIHDTFSVLSEDYINRVDITADCINLSGIDTAIYAPKASFQQLGTNNFTVGNRTDGRNKYVDINENGISIPNPSVYLNDEGISAVNGYFHTLTLKDKSDHSDGPPQILAPNASMILGDLYVARVHTDNVDWIPDATWPNVPDSSNPGSIDIEHLEAGCILANSVDAPKVNANTVSTCNIQSNIAWNYNDAVITGTIGAQPVIDLGYLCSGTWIPDRTDEGVAIAAGKPKLQTTQRRDVHLHLTGDKDDAPPVVIVENTGNHGSLIIEDEPMGRGGNFGNVGLLVVKSDDVELTASIPPALTILAGYNDHDIITTDYAQYGFFIGHNIIHNTNTQAVLIQPGKHDSTRKTNNPKIKAPDVDNTTYLELLGNFKLTESCNIYDKDGTPIVLNGKKV